MTTSGTRASRDAYLIGKLVIRLDCYLPERADEVRARLRHRGGRRFALVADVFWCAQQVSDRSRASKRACPSCPARSAMSGVRGR
jgi:hypothetical protein